MKLKYIKADIVDEIKKDIHIAAVHGCNCFCRMRSGVAKALTDEWPGLAELDRQTMRGSYHKLGCVNHYAVPDQEKTAIYNAYTQYNYGYDKRQYLDYCALKLCFDKIAWNHGDQKGTIVIPKIGCGLAGGDWDKTASILEKIPFGKLQVIVCTI